MCHMDVCAIGDACDESGVGAAEADFVTGAGWRVIGADLEVIFSFYRVRVEFSEFLSECVHF